MTDRRSFDEMSEGELNAVLYQRGWHLKDTRLLMNGATYLLHGVPGSDNANAEPRAIDAADEAEAMRLFLAELDEEQAS